MRNKTERLPGHADFVPFDWPLSFAAFARPVSLAIEKFALAAARALAGGTASYCALRGDR